MLHSKSPVGASSRIESGTGQPRMGKIKKIERLLFLSFFSLMKRSKNHTRSVDYEKTVHNLLKMRPFNPSTSFRLRHPPMLKLRRINGYVGSPNGSKPTGDVPQAGRTGWGRCWFEQRSNGGKGLFVSGGRCLRHDKRLNCLVLMLHILNRLHFQSISRIIV